MDTRVDTALERAAALLGAHARELHDAGVKRLSIFGVDYGMNAEPEIDVAAELDPSANIDLVGLSGLEYRLAEIVGYRVVLYPEPLDNARLQARVDRDRHRVF